MYNAITIQKKRAWACFFSREGYDGVRNRSWVYFLLLWQPGCIIMVFLWVMKLMSEFSGSVPCNYMHIRPEIGNLRLYNCIVQYNSQCIVAFSPFKPSECFVIYVDVVFFSVWKALQSYASHVQMSYCYWQNSLSVSVLSNNSLVNYWILWYFMSASNWA